MDLFHKDSALRLASLISVCRKPGLMVGTLTAIFDLESFQYLALRIVEDAVFKARAKETHACHVIRDERRMDCR